MPNDDTQPDAIPSFVPDFVLPDWLRSSDITPSAPQMPPPSPETVTAIASHPSIMGGQLTPPPPPDFVVPPELAKPSKSQAKPTVAPSLPEAREQDAENRIAQGEQATQAGINEQANTIEHKGEIESQQAGSLANEYAHRNDALYGKGGLAEQRAAQAKADEAALAKRLDAYDKAVNAEANYKVDDNRYFHQMSTGKKVATGIALILSELGQALSRQAGPGPVMQMIQESLKDDVAAQMREREELGKRVGLAKNSIDTYRQLSENKQTQLNLKVAEAYKRTADQIEMTAAQYGSPIAKANAQQAAAQLRTQAAQLTTQSAQSDATRAQQAVQHKQSVGLQVAQMAQSERHFGAQMEQQRQFHNDEVNEKAAQLAQAGRAADAAKLTAQNEQLSQHGVMDANGDYIKQKDGTFYIAPKESSKDLHDQYSGALQMIDAMDKLRELRHQNSGNFNKWSPDAKLKAAEYERALVGAHKAAGIAGFRGNVMEVMDKALSGGTDPTSVLQSVMPMLENAREDAVRDLDHTLRAHNYNGQAIEFPDPLKQKKAPESESQKQLREVENEGGLHAGESQVKEWAKAAATGDKQAVENLQRAAQNAKDPTVRTVAEDALADPQKAVTQLEALERTRGLPMGLYPHLYRFETARIGAEKERDEAEKKHAAARAEEAKKPKKTGISYYDRNP